MVSPRRAARSARAGRTLRPDQDAAFAHAIGPGDLKLVEGRAGTGKSFTLAAIRDAYVADGKRVVGLAPTNAVAQDLAADGFTEAGTVHSALFRLKNGRTSWDRNTVVIVDEAAMLDTPVTGELLAAARQAGAKVILAGDDRQLASIERGGLFAELRQRHGAAEITEVTRQKVDWQRQAARDLAEGRFAEAVNAFDRAGAITWTEKQEDARTALVAAWTRDAADASRSEPVRVRLHQPRRGRAQCRAAGGVPRPRRADRRGCGIRHEAREGGVRDRRPGAVHRHRQDGGTSTTATPAPSPGSMA